MEKAPFESYKHELRTAARPQSAATASSDWRDGLSVLTGRQVTLRELELSDAPSLFAMLSTEEVARFISPPPTTLEGFERFIVWTHRQRQQGEYICFGVVPHGLSTAVGLFQVRRLEESFETAEWGFALGSPYWGSGIFMDAGALVLDFAFDTLNVHRLEARAAIANGRGNGALRKIGAVQEGVLRRSFLRNGVYHDQVLWSILASDWQQRQAIVTSRVLVH